MHLLELSVAIPPNRYLTHELMEILPLDLPREVAQNIRNLGVSARYFVQPIEFSSKPHRESQYRDPVADLIASSCTQALEDSTLRPRDIDYLIVTYDSSTFLCPGLSNMLMNKLGFQSSTKHVSIQGMACSAFPTALQLAEDHLAKFPEHRVMLGMSGANSHWFYNQLRGLKDVKGISQIRGIKKRHLRLEELRKWIAIIEFFLFGDGAACAIVAKQGKGPQFDDFVRSTNIRQSDFLTGYAKLTSLEGPFKFGLYSTLNKNLPELGLEYTKLVFEKLSQGKPAGFQSGAKKWIVHTGSKRILDQIAVSFDLSHRKIKDSHDILAEYGNLAGASLPFILERAMRNGELSRDEYAIMVGFGWGFRADAGVITFQ